MCQHICKINPSSGKAESKHMCIASFDKYCQIALTRSCANLYSYQQFMKLPILSTPASLTHVAIKLFDLHQSGVGGKYPSNTTILR